MTEQTTTNPLHAAIADLSGEVIALVRLGEDVREVEEDASGVALGVEPSNDDPILRALCKGFVLAEAYGEEADCKLFHEAENLYRARGVRASDKGVTDAG
jgi:hypothetical protein